MFEDDEMCLANPVVDPVVTFRLRIDDAPTDLVEKVYSEIVALDEWEVCDEPNRFSAQYHGTTLKHEHILELLGYAEAAVDDSIQKVLSDNQCVEGEASIEIEEIGKYRYSFILPDEGENIIELIDSYHSFEETGSTEE